MNVYLLLRFQWVWLNCYRYIPIYMFWCLLGFHTNTHHFTHCVPAYTWFILLSSSHSHFRERKSPSWRFGRISASYRAY